MYLRELSISRFRSCNHTVVPLQKDLTVLVGENNGGKSNIIDAIRLITAPLNGRRDRYAEDLDLRDKAVPANFEITAEYAGLSDTLKGLLIAAVPDPTKDRAVFGCRYEPQSQENVRGRFTSWAGQFDGNEPESGSTRLIRHVYLPALRDAQYALGSASATRVLSLLRQFLPENDREQFVQSVGRGESTSDVLVRMNREITTALGELTSGVRPQAAQVSFESETIQDIARDLRFKLGDSNTRLDNIRSSGLGYANLLYMATVVVELTKAKDSDLTLFLVEEPEAHLHPQLQRLVLEFLLEKAKKSLEIECEPGQPEGRIQVIVSTHSPNLTAWVSPKHLVVVRSCKEGDSGSVQSACVPVAELGLAPEVMGKINRYLDVTRSALLFGNRVILVEGIAEALLLPAMAQRFVLNGDEDALMRFNGAVLVPIDGVDFRPYVEILLRAHTGVRIADRVVVITDADPSVPGNRKEDLESFATELIASPCLHVYTNRVTFEHELFTPVNKPILREVFLRLHPRSEDAWNEKIESRPPEERADGFLALLSSSKTRKGDFAQELAARIEKNIAFEIPEYLAQAIRKIAEPWN